MQTAVWVRMISFINAIFFMTVTVHVWGLLTAVFILAALCFGLLVGLLKLLLGLFAIVTSTHFGETLGRVFSSLIIELILTITRMWNWGILVPDWMWNFARYEHPWWAFIIAILMLSIFPKWLK